MSTPGSAAANYIKQWSAAGAGYNSDVTLYKHIMSSIMQHSKGARLWLFQLEAFPLLIETQQFQIEKFAAVENEATVLRETITGAQSAFAVLQQLMQKDGTAPGGQYTPSELQQASLVKQDLAGLKSLLGMTGMTAIIGSANITSLKGNISSLWSNFGGPNASPHQICSDLASWTKAAAGGATTTPQIQDINNMFQNLNQTISGTSTQVQTEMQAITQNLQQYLAIYQQSFQNFIQLATYIIQNTNSSSSS